MYASSPELIGFVVWGRPDADDCAEILRSCEIGLKPGIVPHRFIADVRGLEFIDPITFGMFVDYTRKNREILRRNIIRQAQLRPDGLVGAIIAGFAPLARLPYPEKVFGDVEQAIEWLGIDRREGVGLLAEVEQLRSEAFENYPTVSRLRAVLAAHHESTRGAREPSIDDAARRLGVSSRSLQRALRDAGTTYRAEQRALRMRRAHELLRNADRNLEWIAAELGFSTLRHFSSAFRRATGEPPSAWRERHAQR